MRPQRRAALAVIVSIAVHLCALVALSMLERPPEPASPPRPAPLLVEIRHLEPEPPRPSPAPTEPASEKPPLRERRRPARAEATPEPPSTPAPAPSMEDAPLAAAEPTAKPSLFPVIPGVAGHGSPPLRTDSGRGHTLRNDPSERPDPAALAEYEAEQVRARVQGWANDELAAQRVEAGAVDGYFYELRKGLQDAAAHPPPFDGVPFAQKLVRHYVASAGRYGETGNPYVEVPTSGRADEELSPLEQRAEADRSRGPGRKGGGRSSPAEDFRETLRKGALLRDWADGKMTAALVALVELRQSASGRLLGHVLIESSGNELFDAHVMKSAPEAIAKLPPPPERGAGIRSDGLRSLWAFEGRVKYKKKLKDVDWSESWAYHAAALSAGLLTGSFDETTGDIYVVDLTDPQFVCNVKLLRVY